MAHSGVVGASGAGEILHTSQAGMMGRQGNLMFIYATGQATRDVIDQAFALHRAMARRNPQGYATMMVTRADAPMPTREARDAFEKMDRDYGEFMLGSAMVIEGDGLLASTMRLVMRSMSLAYSRKYPIRYCAEPTEALLWLEAQMGSEAHFKKELVLELLGRVQKPNTKVA